MFLFLDTENSGLSRDFSQIFEIALISTDSDLNLMSSLHKRCGRLPWDVPTPGAMLITGITPDQLKKESLSHYEMMKQVSEYINDQNWPIVFAGYNITGYDQGIISQNLHSTLFDPFLMSGRRDWNSEPNCVFDVLELVRAVHIYQPGTLKLKIKTASGKFPSMSLGNVCRQNGVSLSETDAHGAYADTKATIDLTKLLKTKAPDITAQMLKMANRNNVDKFMNDNKVFAYSQCPYGDAHTIIGTKITFAEGSKTEAIVWDLNQDPSDWLNKSDDDLVELFKTWGRDRFKTPIQSLATHKQPIVMPMDMAKGLVPDGLTEAKIKSRIKMLEENQDFAKRLAKAAKNARGPFPKGAEPEQQIYNFPSSDIRRDLEDWKKTFHQVDWQQKQDMIVEFRSRFANEMKKDPALKRFMTFAQRIVYANAPDNISEDHRKRMEKALHTRRTTNDADVPYTTLDKARAELAEIEQQRAEGSETWKHVTDTQIRSLKLFYTSLEKEFEHLVSEKLAQKKRPPNNKGPKI